MKKKNTSYLESDWLFSIELSDEYREFFASKLKSIELEIGQHFNQEKKSIPGILFIDYGKIRVLTRDEKNDLITLNFHYPQQIVGAEIILTNSEELIIASSTTLKGKFLAKEDFVYLYQKDKLFRRNFYNIQIFELYLNLSKNKEFAYIDKKNLLDFTKRRLNDLSEIKLLPPGKHDIQTNNETYIVSSHNVDSLSCGHFIDKPTQITVSGFLPARLIKIPDKNFFNELYLKEDKNYHKTNKNEFQKVALEDWYGNISEIDKFPSFKGKGNIQEVLAVLRMISRYFDLPFRKDVIKSILEDQFNRSKSSSIQLNNIAALINLLGLNFSLLDPNTNELIERLPFPVIALINERLYIIWTIRKNKFLLADPVKGQIYLSYDELSKLINQKNCSILSVQKNLSSPTSKFNLKWFIPSILKYKSSLFQVVLSSFFVQLLALFNPLLIQQIIDAVISQGNYSSLNVLGSLLIIMAIAQALLTTFRTYLFADTTNRIDISLGRQIITHLMRMPLGYFSKRPVGEVSSRLNELENIRNFLTGTALTVLLDSIFSIIYILIMLLYSVKLTFWALGVLPFFVLLTVTVSPILRNQLRKKAQENAKVQSHLVESISGIETLKTQNIELRSELKWEQLYGRQIKASFQNTLTGTAASSASNFLQQISGLIVIWIGASLVINGELTLGELIAFRILSSYVTNPLLRLANLWQNFQETSISLERLADIVDHPDELDINGKNLPALPPIKGKISFEEIDFKFNKNSQLQLQNIELTINPYSFVGLVGTSGSGKSTLIKLLTRLYLPNRGIIRIDDINISKVDLYSLRSQIGVVSQDSLLFNGTIQENIAVIKPDATFEEITNAAKIACAHDFIENFNDGYNQNVGEKGSLLSGGQKQRIAIARMILKDPPLIILDESTSALDPNTEKNVLSNIRNFSKNKTIIFITHRLGNLTDVDKIYFLQKGKIEEEGNHIELMNKNGKYSVLFNQQINNNY